MPRKWARMSAAFGEWHLPSVARSLVRARASFCYRGNVRDSLSRILSTRSAATASRMAKGIYTNIIRRFLYDGNRINDDDTPASLDMEDNGTLHILA